MEEISTNYYLKIINMMDELMLTSDFLFQQHVLSCFEKHFGFNQANFWICDSNNNLTSPIMLNGNPKAMDDYLKNFYQLDFLIPQNVQHLLCEKRVVRILDIIPSESYEKSEYYNNFMKKYGFYHSIGVYLHDGTKLLGLIDFIRSKNDKPFSNNDVKCLEIISRYLSQKTKNHLQFREGNFKNHVISASSLNANKLQDGSDLTNKEREVLDLVKKGYSNRDIAKYLFISTNTVSKHLQSIYRKFDVSNRTSLCYKVYNHKK